MKSTFKWLVFTFIFFLHAASVAAERLYCPPKDGASVVGSFFHKDQKSSGTPDYCEYHIFDKSLFSGDSLSINGGDKAAFKKTDSSYKVLYKTFQGDQFAEKTLDFSGGLNTPLVDQLDSRRGEVRRAYLNRDNKDSWTILYQKTSDDSEDISVVKKADIDVNDAGFVYRVRSHWQELVNGETIKFSFLSMPHGKTINMSAKKINSDQCEKGKKTTGDLELVCIKVSISNVFFRLIAPALWLSFDPVTQQLDVYKGIVNIRDQQGENQSGSIFYEYF